MGYVDNNLMAGEQVAYRTKLHWIVFFWPIALLIISFLISGPEVANLRIIMFISAMVWGMITFITYKSSEFAVTNKRVLIKTGFIRRNTIETLLPKVEGVQVDQGIFGRILNYGTIKVTGTGGTSSPFHKIDEPLEFRKKVQEQISAPQQA